MCLYYQSIDLENIFVLQVAHFIKNLFCAQ